MRFYKYLVLLTSLFVVACSNSTTTFNTVESAGSGQPADTILHNTTFVLNGKPSLNGWLVQGSTLDSNRSEASEFIFDKPNLPHDSANAQWSLGLRENDIPISAFTDFIGLSSGIYLVSVWAKDSGNAQGQFYVEQSATPDWKISAIMNVTNSDWQQLQLADSLVVTPNDTVHVVLRGGVGSNSNAMTLYNRISFVKLR